MWRATLALLMVSRARSLLVTMVRHGETEWNVVGKLQASSPDVTTPSTLTLTYDAPSRRRHPHTHLRTGAHSDLRVLRIVH